MVAILCILPLLLAIGVKCDVLRDFQVVNPVVVPRNTKTCTIPVIRRNFAWSYGLPEIVDIAPPTDCGPIGSWAAITLNLTVTSNGTQYDRLGTFTFQNVEIWRTTTPEPSRGQGIIWTYIKDLTRYIPLFSKPGRLIFQLDNIVQPGLDGEYDTTVEATFYASSPDHPPAPRSDLILPISTFSNNSANYASVPPAFSVNITLPRNAVEVYAELYASGNGQEEFWYFNAANEFIGELPENTAYGQGAFREVRILVDGKLAGSAFPFAAFYTGAFVPLAWSYFMDLTPFVPLLTDGLPHVFTIDVVSAEKDHTTLSNWYVSGLLQVKTDSSGKPTKGKMTVYEAAPYAETSVSGSVSPSRDSVNITVNADRNIHIESTIVAGSGKKTNVVYSQHMSFTNTQSYLNNTFTQNMWQNAAGYISSTHNGRQVLQDAFSYPMNINVTFFTPAFNSYSAFFDQNYDRALLPAPFLPGTDVHSHTLHKGYRIAVPTGGTTGNGTASVQFAYSDRNGNSYYRNVDVALNVITKDQQSGSLAQYAIDSVTGGSQTPFTGARIAAAAENGGQARTAGPGRV